MNRQPTYTATQIKEMCLTWTLDYTTFKILTELVEEEMERYSEEDLIILCQASMILFSRSMLRISLKHLE
jgi:hypothetical protein